MMKKFLLICLLFLMGTSALLAQDIPKRPTPPRLVNDLAQVMTPDQVASLEAKLVAYDDSTSNQIAVVTVKSLGGYEIEEYALKILRDWGVGNKATNNGIVIVAAIDDRKIRIETGYGLEGAVPDITAKQIIDNDITPAFREGNYYRGFDHAAESIMKAAAGEYKAPAEYRDRKRTKERGIGGGAIVLAVIIIIISLISRGGGGGGMMSRRGYRGWNGPVFMDWGGFGGGGGRSGGGGWSGGGGGFGGFGGGSGGGGGASGSW